MKIMVSGTRHLGECAHPGDTLCGPARNHYYDMDAAFRVHVHPVAGQRPELWHGHARGADTLALRYWGVYSLGQAHGIPARWDTLGGRAGHVRNGLLVAQMPDMFIAFPYEGGSPGTWDAIAQARAAGIHPFVYPVHSLCALVLPVHQPAVLPGR